jgi:hypothetical protein
MKMKNISADFDNLFDEFDVNEYEEIFPEDQEYQSWMAAIERDYAAECNLASKLDVTDKVNVIVDDDDITDDDVFPHSVAKKQQSTTNK